MRVIHVQGLGMQLPFAAAWGLGNPHVQTIWSTVARRPATLATRREVWRRTAAAPVDVVLLPERPGRPGVLVLHGLEGSYRSTYVQGMLAAIAGQGWNGAVLEFRSCGPTPADGPQLYHSGKVDEIEFTAQELQRRWRGRLAACGFSLGGNALLKWMGESKDQCPVVAAVAISVPFDLAACASSLDAPSPFAWLYRHHFLRSLKRKACQTARAHQVPFTSKEVRACKTLRDFDGLVTAPLFGFASAEDYWERNSSQRFLHAIKRPTLLVAAADDPFIPRSVLPQRAIAENPHLSSKFTPRGGHVGFIAGSIIRPRYAAEAWTVQYLSRWL